MLRSLSERSGKTDITTSSQDITTLWEVFILTSGHMREGLWRVCPEELLGGWEAKGFWVLSGAACCTSVSILVLTEPSLLGAQSAKGCNLQ